MAKLFKDEEVYKCTVCGRKTRVKTNQKGLNIVYHCTITAGCLGKLAKVSSASEILNTPIVTPNEPGLQNWFQRKLLYNHSQTLESNNWIITHNLGNNPIMYVYVYVNDKLVEYVPDITTIDKNTTQLTFDKKYTGIAQAVSLSTQNLKNITTTTKKTIIEPTIDQISNDYGILTIATLSTDPTININMKFNGIEGKSPILVQYTNIDDTPVVLSPWTDTSVLFINGKNYTVRTINVAFDPANIQYFSSGQIPHGSSFIFSTLNGNPINTGEVFILLSASPHQTSDKKYDKIIDVSSIKNPANQYMTYSRGKLYANSTIIKNIYPFIIVVK